MYVYESHLGGLYTSEEQIPLMDRCCEQCGDRDWEIGDFHSPQEFLMHYANDIDCNDGNGGYFIDDIFKDVLSCFDKKISKEEAIKIVQTNRTLEEGEMYDCD